MSLINVGQYLCRLAITFWLGEMLFFIVIFAPRVFKVLPREMAGQLQGAIFPAYYTAGIVSAAILLVGLTLRYAGGDSQIPLGSRFSILMGLIAFAAIIFIYSRVALIPRIDALRLQIHGANATPEAAARFDKLHKLSVRANGAALLALLYTLGAL